VRPPSYHQTVNGLLLFAGFLALATAACLIAALLEMPR
jgi:hypothetical protein